MDSGRRYELKQQYNTFSLKYKNAINGGINSIGIFF